MSYVGIVNAANADHFVASTAYGTCATAAGTAQKDVVMPEFDTLLTGVTVHVLFQNSNTASDPKLNVNNTGAKAIYTSGIVSPGQTVAESWAANSIMSFTYDGSAWRMNDAIGALLSELSAFESKGLSLTVLSTGWSSESPYTQTLTATGVTSTNNIIVGLGSTATSEQYNAANAARFICSGQANNSITLKCYGVKPTVNIPINVVILA